MSLTKIILIFTISCCPFISKGQQLSNELKVLEYIYKLDFENSKKKLTVITNIENKIALNNLLQIIEHRGQSKNIDSVIVKNLKLDDKDIFRSTINNITKAFYLINNVNDNASAVVYFDQAYKKAGIIDHDILKKMIFTGQLELYYVQFPRISEEYKDPLTNLKKNALTTYDSLITKYYENFFYSTTIKYPELFFNSSIELIKLEKRNKDISPAIKGRILDNIAVYYRIKQEDTIAKYLSQRITELPNNLYNNKSKLSAYKELALLSARNKKYDESKNYIDKARQYNLGIDSLETNYRINRFKAIYVHAPLKEYDSAYYKLSNSLEYENAKRTNENQEKIALLNIELETAEKEKQILVEQTQKKLNQNIALGLGGSLVAVSIIAFLVYRNTKRKQRIAEQDRELQIQKTETILKEKELETINAMVSGQEKERLRLAGELHDNIGSTLATVRMQVENLERNLDKVDDPKALLQKTHLLINETYEKVRGISHKSNSGVMAKEGLLPAIQKLARTVSTTNKLAIDVQDFGLEDRIANELEITIFRIIQELVTNIVKHAQATEATISLTQHDNELNIIVEDNGKGFKAGKLQEKDGMGLGTIERRIEHLEGTMEVDSTQGRGTSVSIDIPLAII